MKPPEQPCLQVKLWNDVYNYFRERFSSTYLDGNLKYYGNPFYNDVFANTRQMMQQGVTHPVNDVRAHFNLNRAIL